MIYNKLIDGQSPQTHTLEFIVHQCHGHSISLCCPKFNQTVRIRSILIKSSSASQAPKLVKILVNKTAISFDDVEDAQEPEVAQILELTPEQVAGEGQAVPLRFVRFQNVNSIHVSVFSHVFETNILVRVDGLCIICSVGVSDFRRIEPGWRGRDPH